MATQDPFGRMPHPEDMATSTPPAPPSPSGPRVECPNCGATATGQPTICAYCATPMPPPASAAPPPMAPPPQMNMGGQNMGQNMGQAGGYNQTSFPIPVVAYTGPTSRSWGWFW